MPLRAIETATFNGGSSQSVTMPATAEVGDIATLIVAAYGTVSTDLSGSGWTLHGNTEPTTSNARITVWTKTVAAPDIAAPVVITASNGRWAMAIMVRYGVTGLDVAPVFITVSNLATTITAPDITTTTANAELVSIYGCQVYLGAAIVTYALPSGQTKIVEICSGSSSNSNATLAIGEEIVATVGSVGARQATTTNIVPENDGRVRTGAVTLAFTSSVVAQVPTVRVRQSGAWVQKLIKARAGGTWV